MSFSQKSKISGNLLSRNRFKSKKPPLYGGRMKVDIPKEELKELYLKKKLTTYQIAKLYGCWNTTIGNKLKAFGIKRRNPKKKKVFPKELLKEL